MAARPALADSRAPLVVGVVAQPGLTPDRYDPAGLAAAAAAYVTDLRRRFPHTPVLLLTALATEAEAVAAEAALAAGPADGPPTELVMVAGGVPAGPTAARLAAAHRALDLPTAGADAARFIARSCAVLLAVYEPAASAPEAVRVKRHGVPDPADVLETPETGPIVRLDPRPGPGGPGWERVAPEVYDDEPAQREVYFERLDRALRDRLDRFNRDAGDLVPADPAGWARCRDYLTPEGRAGALPPAAAGLRDAYATADFLALHYQGALRRRVRLCVGVLVVALVAFSAFAHLAKEGPPKHVALAVYLALLALADYLLLGLFRGPLRQQLYQDYRALAEGLRVQYGWWLGGVRRFAADHYLAHQKNDLDWIRQALKGLAVRAAARTPGGPPPLTADLSTALDVWVIDQLRFYRRNALRERAKYVLRREAASGLLVASLLLSLGVAGYESARALGYLGPGHDDAPGWVNALTLALLAVPVGVGAYHLAARVREAGEQAAEEQEEVRQAGDIKNKVPAVGLLGPGDVPNFRLRRWGGFLGLGVGGGLAFAALLASATVDPTREWIKGSFKDDPHDWLIVAMVFVVFLAALVQWHVEQRAFRLHHRNYRRMRAVFARAYLLAVGHQSANPAAAARVLERLGEAALAEHAGWLRLHRDRPVELPRLEL